MLSRFLRWTTIFAVLAAVAGLLVASGGSSTGNVAAASVRTHRGGWTGPTSPALVGVQYRGMWGDQTNAQRRQILDRLAAAGTEWVRVGVPWVMMQPRRPKPGDSGYAQFAFDRLSLIVRMAQRRGIKVSATFGRTPPWANGGKGTLYLPDRPSTFARALHHLVHRYRGRIDSWEIWNEPNNSNYLRGATAQDYTRLLCAAHQAVKSAAPGAEVVAGGTSGNDYAWYRRVYRAGGKGCFDVLAVHPYNSNRSPYYRPPSSAPWWFQNVRIVRRVMRRHHDLKTPIWFTEVGWSTHRTYAGPAGHKGVTLAQQARYLTQLFRITHRRYPYVRRISWYMDEDMTQSTLHKDSFGLFRRDGTAKPAYQAMRTYTNNLNR